MKYTFGLIGAGNMGGAIAKAVSRSLKDGVLVDRDQARADSLAAELGFTAVSKSMMVAAFGLPIMKLMMVMLSLVEHCIDFSAP